MNKYAQTQGKGIQDIQNLVATGITPIIKLAEVLKPHIMVNPEAKTLLSDSLTLLRQVQFNLSTRRRYFIRPNLKKKYHSLCNISKPITDKLFGDDITKDIKTCDSLFSLSKEQNYGYYSRPQRGAGRGSHFPRDVAILVFMVILRMVPIMGMVMEPICDTNLILREGNTDIP